METRELAKALTIWEGFATWLYCDSIGLVTTGIGCLVKDPIDLENVIMWEGSTLATMAAKTEAHIRTACAYDKKHPEPAAFYKSCSSLRLTMGGVVDLASRRLERIFLPHLRNRVPGFDSLSDAWQTALVDIVWNCGCAGFDRFERMIAAVNRRDGNGPAGASKCCHRKTSRDARNKWAEAQFLKPC